MLKRIDMAGFKSFADKIRFDFATGITCIVGPNGSGKSNVVDAVRWVLGEQSAKSLRAGEMSDVIFNGSASRRSLGLAEVTLTFDNSRRLLARQADEIQVTRRVYRSGEGEYLINQQPSRLKDIKDLMLGSGVGADAYSIIEQGRVENLLQASNQERRVIFEEAAGISRVKVRKVETQRRLERVDQNLQRLLDIIEEVQKQLRSVKLQAAKAQRYQEYSGRLREVRMALALDEYHQFVVKLREESAALDSVRGVLADRETAAQNAEKKLAEQESALAGLEDGIHQSEGRLAASREQISALKTSLDREWSLSADLADNHRRCLAQLAELNAHLGSLAKSSEDVAAEVELVAVQENKQREDVDALERCFQSAAQRMLALQAQLAADKNDHLEHMRFAARQQNDVVSFKAHVENLRREHERLRQKTVQGNEQLGTLDSELQTLKDADDRLQEQMTAARETLGNQRIQRDGLGVDRDRTNALLAQLRESRSGLASRIEVLERLEQSHEGLGTGVREVLDLRRRSDPGPWNGILGMVADFLSVKHEHATLIELALGDRAQHLLIRDGERLQQALAGLPRPLAGRVSFMAIESEHSGQSSQESEVEANAGVVARADRLVTFEHPELQQLASRLLAKTFVVQDLAAARSLVAVRLGCRCITLKGEVLEADGTLTVGTHHAEAGLISRKSELRDLRQQVQEVEESIRQSDAELLNLRRKIAEADVDLEQRQQAIDVLTEQVSDLRLRIGQQKEKRKDLHQEMEASRSEIGGIEADIRSLEESWAQARRQAEEAERQVQTLKARIDKTESEVRQGEESHQEQQQKCTAAKVALVQVSERLAGLRTRQRQLGDDVAQRRQERTLVEQQMAAAQARIDESQRVMLQASSDLARLYLVKEAEERTLADLALQRESLKLERSTMNEKVQAAHAAWRTDQETLHNRELAVNDLRHHKDSLVDRLRDDYQLDLPAIYDQHIQEKPLSSSTSLRDPPLERVGAIREIEELRGKLHRLGSVNLDSLQELTELEQRAASLQVQHDDLIAAKGSLEDIIQKINVDSRRQFVEAFQTIRTHFQELFRKLFGGGMADIVLEDENDVLESGIEIIARPPGKELRSISLMSGGEKTLTAVGLLLAIFRSKPSPFCLLDEVDAALDEANIGRFAAVIREFLDQSQFIIITHSKRTMACADVLYGVTMQESGVSRRMAVRFNDWASEERQAAAG